MLAAPEEQGGAFRFDWETKCGMGSAGESAHVERSEMQIPSYLLGRHWRLHNTLDEEDEEDVERYRTTREGKFTKVLLRWMDILDMSGSYLNIYGYLDKIKIPVR